MAFLRQRIGLILRILISGGILAYLAIYKIEWAKLGEHIRTADPAWIAFAVLLIGITMFLAAWRWQILLRVQHVDPGYWPVFKVSMIGQFFNAFLLGTTGGDVVKIFYIAQLAHERKSAAGLSVIFDRLVGLVALVGLTVSLTACHYGLLASSTEGRRWLWIFYFIAAGVAGVLLLAWALPAVIRSANLKRLEQKLPFHAKIEHLSEAFRRHARSGRINLEALLLSIVAQAMLLVSQYCITRALHLPVPLLFVAGVTGLVYVLISVPISIGGLGVRESLFILYLGLAGVSSEGAVAASLIGFSIGLFWSLVGGMIHLRYKHPLPAAVTRGTVV